MAESVDTALTCTTIKSKTPEKTVPETTIEPGNRRLEADRRGPKYRAEAGFLYVKAKSDIASSDTVNALVCEEALERIHPMDGDGRIIDRRNAFLLKFLEQAVDGLAADADHRRPVFLGKP